MVLLMRELVYFTPNTPLEPSCAIKEASWRLHWEPSRGLCSWERNMGAPKGPLHHLRVRISHSSRCWCVGKAPRKKNLLTSWRLSNSSGLMEVNNVIAHLRQGRLFLGERWQLQLTSPNPSHCPSTPSSACKLARMDPRGSSSMAQCTHPFQKLVVIATTGAWALSFLLHEVFAPEATSAGLYPDLFCTLPPDLGSYLWAWCGWAGCLHCSSLPGRDQF